jgi:hypothetical protein
LLFDDGLGYCTKFGLFDELLFLVDHVLETCHLLLLGFVGENGNFVLGLQILEIEATDLGEEEGG